ncbi:MAG: hypothetical protein BWX66_02130 [Deltaproteobacteria bacterium ADurb.Bin058]|nr:MAG: hypothetical protein BWX66_02130 [Deltaproteobacteria bacterium ADurb.Bin058]
MHKWVFAIRCTALILRYHTLLLRRSTPRRNFCKGFINFGGPRATIRKRLGQQVIPRQKYQVARQIFSRLVKIGINGHGEIHWIVGCDKPI